MIYSNNVYELRKQCKISQEKLARDLDISRRSVSKIENGEQKKDFDFSFQPRINQQEISEYNTLRFLSENENLVFLGPSGVGKTHLATSIGITAAKKRISTYFIKCNDLLQQLKKAQSENRLGDRLKHFSKYKLLIIDELCEDSHNSLKLPNRNQGIKPV